MRIVSLSKLDVSKRELEHAIRLFFSGGDFVVIYLVISACQEILYKIGGEAVSLRNYMKSVIKKDKQKEVFDKINYAYNFLKHADRDPKELLDFNPEACEIAILDAVAMYQEATGEITGLMTAYRGWFYIKNPDLLLEGELKKALASFGPNIDINNKRLFLDIAEAMENKRTGA